MQQFIFLPFLSRRKEEEDEKVELKRTALV